MGHVSGWMNAYSSTVHSPVDARINRIYPLFRIIAASACPDDFRRYCIHPFAVAAVPTAR